MLFYNNSKNDNFRYESCVRVREYSCLFISCYVNFGISIKLYICFNKLVLGIWRGYYIRKRNRRKSYF